MDDNITPPEVDITAFDVKRYDMHVDPRVPNYEGMRITSIGAEFKGKVPVGQWESMELKASAWAQVDFEGLDPTKAMEDLFYFCYRNVREQAAAMRQRLADEKAAKDSPAKEA